jgi:hypothetical protein
MATWCWRMPAWVGSVAALPGGACSTHGCSRKASFHPLWVMPAVPAHLRVKEPDAEEALS